MKKQRRNSEVFNLSFLDVITCGFGAIILLLVITKTGTITIPESSPESFDNGLVRDLQSKLFEIRGESTILTRNLENKQQQISLLQDRLTRLQIVQNSNQNRFDNLKDDSDVQIILADKFKSAKQELTTEMKRLLAQSKQQKPDLVGGIPVDSEYIIFIVDTSGSMVSANWGKMINQLTTTLDAYPKVKGLQIMSDMGSYLFSQYRGKWIPDTPGRRRAMVSNLRIWNTFSNSSPVEGITQAMRTFSDPDKKISIYVFGDEFTGNSIHAVTTVINRLNRKDKSGASKVRIHGVGFPVPLNAPEHFQITNQRFATLMREVSHKNGGTFVGLL
ncbi:MAG: VWA domain-containing protein [Proteobacteria bacterium]|nr:VWA domain-containing protein [Pseudomonadota bacterium]